MKRFRLLSVLIGSSLLLFVSCSLPFVLTPEKVERRITKTFAAAEATLEKDPSGLESQRILNESRLLIDTIQPYFYGVPGAPHEHSAARQDRVEEVEKWFGKYEPFFLELIGTLSDPNTNSSVVTNYANFTAPTQQIKSALLEVARAETSRPENAAAAYNSIFALKLDDPEIRREIVETLDWLDERHSRSGLAAEVRNLGAISWAMPEMLGYWRTSLLVPYAPKNFPVRGGSEKLVTQYRWAASALSHFGPMDNDLAALARQRADELENAGGNQRTVDKLVFAAEILEGTRPPELAVNWKGQFLGATELLMQEK